MRRKKKQDADIDLIPVDTLGETVSDGSEYKEDKIVETEKSEVQTAPGDTDKPEAETVAGDTDKPEAETVPEDVAEPESDSAALFGEYVADENKWERKNRIREEKERAKQEKKRARYADVDDETYESMKAGGARKFFGVLMLFVLVAGIASAALIVYRLVFAPSYAQVGEKEKNIQVEGLATDGDTSRFEAQVTALQGIATPSDLTDTWVEQPFTPATPGDGQAEEQDLDGISVPSEEPSQEETQEVTD